jgi:hypothetical protein
MDGSFALLGKQAVGVAVAGGYSAAVTALLCLVAEGTVGLRSSPSEERSGLDRVDHHEVAYEWLEMTPVARHVDAEHQDPPTPSPMAVVPPQRRSKPSDSTAALYLQGTEPLMPSELRGR